MGFLSDFKAFAVKGNVVDLAVGVVIGAAFGKIVSSLVDDIIMPLVGTVTGNEKFTDKFIVLGPGKEGVDHFKTLEDAKAAGANVLAYGHLIQSIVDFIIIALCIFVIIRLIAKMHRKNEDVKPSPVPSTSDTLLTEIRDLLKKQA